ncbi:hypothetical protein M3611_26585 [Priestia megaterium]|uniref:hypothetical protein n=1 Tax=Priestia megaterium TaxID=1404 RepID=UPI002040D36B|nr:hypothetical protein [Priestia megaterium]MCM3155564.1 hypothetical protein [Priestia megaterium]
MAAASEKQVKFMEDLLAERGLDLVDIGFDGDWIFEDEEKGQAVASGVIAILLKLPKAE